MFCISECNSERWRPVCQEHDVPSAAPAPRARTRSPSATMTRNSRACQKHALRCERPQLGGNGTTCRLELASPSALLCPSKATSSGTILGQRIIDRRHGPLVYCLATAAGGRAHHPRSCPYVCFAERAAAHAQGWHRGPAIAEGQTWILWTRTNCLTIEAPPN
jgi:hypothetical protein